MVHPEFISAKDLDAYPDDPNALIIDLRPVSSYRRSHVRTAWNIPYEKLENSPQEINQLLKNANSEEKLLVLYCDRGGSSLKAAKQLSLQGYHVCTVIGGFRAYRGQNLVFFEKT